MQSVCLQTAEWLCWLAAIKHCWLTQNVMRLWGHRWLTVWHYDGAPHYKCLPVCALLSELWAEHHGNTWQRWKSIIPNQRPHRLFFPPNNFPSHRAGVAKGLAREPGGGYQEDMITVNTWFKTPTLLHNNTGITSQTATAKFNKHNVHELKEKQNILVELQPLNCLNGYHSIL